ncbi:hypothetical protein MK137Hg11_000211000, partial [Dysgonomonas reticulitermitis]
FPFRTEKLSPVVPMVLRISGRVGYRRFKREVLVQIMYGDFLRFITFCFNRPHNYGSRYPITIFRKSEVGLMMQITLLQVSTLGSPCFSWLQAASSKQIDI